MIISGNLCNDLLAVQLDNGVLDLSWGLDTDAIIEQLQTDNVDKVLNFADKIDFIIQIDSDDKFDDETADKPNLKTYRFSEIDKRYAGKIVYSCVVNFNRNQFEETTYYFRVKIAVNGTDFIVKIGGEQSIEVIEFEDTWSEPKQFTIKKDFTKDIVDIMYRMVADFNAYNKEVSSANFYYLLQASADTINREYQDIIIEKEKHFLDKSHPDYLDKTFGTLFKFTDVSGISMEEYRRIMRELIIGYQNGGAWNFIKRVLKYLVGYTPKVTTLKDFYPWVLRKKEPIYFDKDGQVVNDRPDPENFADRNYYNPESNYYLFTTNFINETVPSKVNRNKIMLFEKGEKTFTFILNVDNFFNYADIDETKIKTILNILKSVYTKYELFISAYETPADFNNLLLANSETYILAKTDEVITY